MTELTPGRATLLYTVSRFALFAVLFVVLLFVTGFLWAAIGAAVLSSIASYFLLARYRVAMSGGVEARLVARRERSLARAAREDEAAEELIRAEQSAREYGD